LRGGSGAWIYRRPRVLNSGQKKRELGENVKERAVGNLVSGVGVDFAIRTCRGMLLPTNKQGSPNICGTFAGYSTTHHDRHVVEGISLFI
jgi:hypothetical protein